MSTAAQQEILRQEMARVDRELDARVEHALIQAREVEQATENLAARQGPPEPPSDEEVRRIKDFVLNHGRTEEWERVIKRIDSGQLTWREVVESMSTGRVDRSVAAAFDSLSRVTPVSMEALVASGVFPPMPTDEPTAAGSSTDEKPAARPPRPRVADLPDEDFYGDPLRHDDDSSW